MGPRRDEYDDEIEDDRDWSEHAYDEDQDDEEDDGDSDDDESVPCPHCRRPVYEDAEQCPHCGRYLSREDAPPGAKPLWIVVTVVVILAAILLTWIF